MKYATSIEYLQDAAVVEAHRPAQAAEMLFTEILLYRSFTRTRAPADVRAASSQRCS